MGVAGLSVLVHVPTPPANSSSSRHVGREAISHSLHSLMTPFWHSWPYSIVFSYPSPRRGWNFPSSRKETIVFLSIAFLSSHTGFSFGFCACSELDEWPQGHDFCCVCEIVVVFIYNSSLLLVYPAIWVAVVFPTIFGCC